MISVEELQNALDNVEGKKPTERLLAGPRITTAPRRPSWLSGTMFSDERSTIGSYDSTLTRLLSRLSLTITDLEETKKFQYER